MASPPPIVEAMNITLFMLTELLEREGVLDQQQLADAVASWSNADKPELSACMLNIAQTIEARHFAQKGPQTWSVIDGGRD